MSEPAREPGRHVLRLIMLGVVAWGLFHAAGAYFGGPGLATDARRAFIVLACVGAFLGFWLLMLFSRRES